MSDLEIVRVVKRALPTQDYCQPYREQVSDTDSTISPIAYLQALIEGAWRERETFRLDLDIFIFDSSYCFTRTRRGNMRCTFLITRVITA